MKRSRCLGTAIGVLVLAAPASAFATTYTWIGPGGCAHGPCSGSWTDANNWSPTGVPSTSDTVSLPAASQADGGTTITSASGTVASLTISGGYLELDSPSLTVGAGGSFTWSDGILNGGKIALSTGVTGTINATIEIDGGELDNAGTLAWTAGTILGDDGAIIRNSGTMNASNGVAFGYRAGTDEADLYNTGTFKFAGPGTLSSTGAFWGLHNGGTLNVVSGAIEMAAAASSNNSLDDGNHVTGAGVLRFREPTFQYGVASPTSVVKLTGTTNVDAGATIELAHGGVLTGSGTIAGPGTFVWSGGQLQGGIRPRPSCGART